MTAMTTTAVIDVEELLEPIPGSEPSGRFLAYEAAYDQIREARRSEDAFDQGAWERETKVAEWDRVIDLGTDALRHQTKDLQIAAWLAEALARRHGFDGLRDGLRLLSGVQERFWETYHPQIDEGDLGSREGPFVFLNTTLPMLIRQVPLTAGTSEPRYSYLQWQESREVQNVGLKDPKAMQALTDAGKVTPKQWDDAVAQTPRRFFEGLFQALLESGEAFRDFEEGTDRHFGREAPSLLNVRKALEECRRLLEPIVAAKRAQEPDPELDGHPPGDTPAGAAPGQSESHDGVARPETGQGLPIPNGSGSTALDFGRMLIDFQRRAEELAETGKLLTENRQKHAELKAEIGKLDSEYLEMSTRLGKSQEFYQLLSRLLELHNGAASRAGDRP
jgi:type VI secretion system protein ImpA